MKYRGFKVNAFFAITILFLGAWPCSAQALDRFQASDIDLAPGGTGQISLYLTNETFPVGGISMRLELKDSLQMAIIGLERGVALADFEYFQSRFGAGSARIVAIANWPGGGAPAPLPLGRHEVARIIVSTSPELSPGAADSLYFVDDGVPPDRDNSISDDSGYRNVVPELIGARMAIPSALDAAEDAPALPGQAELFPNYPNPFNAGTTITFELSTESGAVALEIYDLAGRRVRAFEWASLVPGRHAVVWNGTDDAGWDVSSGVYFCRLATSGNPDKTLKMTLLR